MGAHTVGMNDKSIGICLVGNFDATLPTKEQKTELKRLLEEKMAQWSIPTKNIVPHRYFAQKTCYGSKLADSWAKSLVSSPVEKIVDIFIDAFIGRAVKRAIVDNKTGLEYPVLSTTFGSEEVIFKTSIGDITFSNIGKTGELKNNDYSIKIL